ncbi:PREDICTED: protein DEHYDRATION-INDUCED 19 homolog 4-like [Populus euphratica]|uniref:Protein DEHYDRATION-INDUCED 19 homolog 4-like n=1 Tax=Populus euphratica TaxID=75702 RepID=A0AAJ6XA45_POPEU|nr:PREDICTED: protein DEHYDRATION-INDUCED 19 homolog 4-like [Populus euphratica]
MPYNQSYLSRRVRRFQQVDIPLKEGVNKEKEDFRNFKEEDLGIQDSEEEEVEAPVEEAGDNMHLLLEKEEADKGFTIFISPPPPFLNAQKQEPSQPRTKKLGSDLYDETEIEEDLKAEYLCPFCGEDFDVVGLFCHIDEKHLTEAKNGIYPVCAKRVGMNIVTHITWQHGNFFNVQRKRRLRRGGANSAFSILRKELREGSLQSLLGGSLCFVLSSNIELDPLLSPFIFVVIDLQNWKT